MSDFAAAMAKVANNRASWPILVSCQQVAGPLRGVAPCTGHAGCRAAYWQRVDDAAAAAVRRRRVELGALRPKRRIRA